MGPFTPQVAKKKNGMGVRQGRYSLLLLCWLWLASAVAEPGLSSRPANPDCMAPERPPADTPLTLESVAQLDNPLYMVEDHQGHWFVVTRGGLLNVYTEGASFTLAGTALDLTGKVVLDFFGGFTEFGALGLALDPDFANNGHLYIFYTTEPQTNNYEARLSRFTTLDGTNFDINSEEVVFSYPLLAGFHLGGTLAFGPDGNLYLSIGDGVVGADAQDPFSINGKLLRFDVNGGLPYQIPPDNPYADGQNGAPEVFALGFRNPFRFSIDRATGDIWLGDVGQDMYEEIDLVINGGNYGWPIREAAHCFGAPACDTTGLIDPVYEILHGSGPTAVIGGLVYHGASLPSLQGSYVFAEHFSGIFKLEDDGEGNFTVQTLVNTDTINALAESSSGDLYILTGNDIQRVIPAAGGSPVNFPATLSQTGCFDTIDPREPGDGLIPFRVSSPLWSDDAAKERYLALPDGTFIHINGEDDWDFPIGSVLIKHFLLNDQYVETRLFVRHDDGDWGGYSYEWNDAQTEAFLLPGAKDKDVNGQIWHFPSRVECFQCHTEVAGRSLGPETAQLNSDLLYEQTGLTANQVETLAAIGVFDSDPGLPGALPYLPDPLGDDRIDLRARSYLHANCSFCHRPDGPGQGPADFRYQVPGGEMGVVNVLPTQGDLGILHALLIAPGHPEQSIVSARIRTLGPSRMPPLASSVVDDPGAQVIDDWILSSLGLGLPEMDFDSDTVENPFDNCPSDANTDQLDTDDDGDGNACDADDDDDGMSDTDEETYGFDPLDPADADEDADGDGVSNLAEIQAGTDPRSVPADTGNGGGSALDLWTLMLLIMVMAFSNRRRFGSSHEQQFRLSRNSSRSTPDRAVICR